MPLDLFSNVWTFSSNFEALHPHPPLPNLMGGTSPEASAESPEASVQGLGGPLARPEKLADFVSGANQMHFLV